jgi:DNA polymerase-3 subunit delta'
MELARALCCPDRKPEGVPCRICAVCRRIGRGVFPDVTTFNLQTQAARDGDKSRNLTLNIGTVREVASAVAYRPAEAAWRVAIVDDVETMQETAQEAFLKTLEEPPPFVVLILITTDVEALLPTILSRCRVIRFGSSPAGDVRDALTSAGVETAQAVRIADAAQGSMGWAFDSANDDSLVSGREADARAALDFVMADPYQRVVEAIHLADEFGKAREAVFGRLDLFQAIWRSALYVRQGVDSASGAALTKPIHADIRSQSTEDLIRAIRAVDTCVANLEANVRPRLALQSMVLGWPRMDHNR